MQFENFSRFFKILIVVLSTQHTLNAYAECIEGNCVNGKGTLTSADGFKYVGEWKNGQPHGQGILTSPEGSAKTGIWRYGEPISDNCKEKGLRPNTRAYQRCLLKLID